MQENYYSSPQSEVLDGTESHAQLASRRGGQGSERQLSIVLF